MPFFAVHSQLSGHFRSLGVGGSCIRAYTRQERCSPVEVCWDQYSSSSLSTTSGCGRELYQSLYTSRAVFPGGSVLGPILFLVFINDLPVSVKSSSRLFADDCVVYREIRSEKDCQILQDGPQKLWQWEKLWAMSFHSEKCSILRVHSKRSPIMFNYSLKGLHSTVKNLPNTLGLRSHMTLHVNSI